MRQVAALEEQQDNLLSTIHGLQSVRQSPAKSPLGLRTSSSRSPISLRHSPSKSSILGKSVKKDTDDQLEDFNEILACVNEIEEKLFPSNGDSDLGLSRRIKPELSLNSSNTGTFLNLIRHIDSTVENHMERYTLVMDDSEKVRQDYANVLDMYNSLKSDLDGFVSRGEAEAAIAEIEQVVYEKEQELAELRNEKSELWSNIRVVNQGLAEIERERAGLIQMNTHLMQKNEELHKLASSQNPMVEELESLSNEKKDLKVGLDQKEKALQSLTLSYSNCEAELEAKNTEVKALQERINSLKIGSEINKELPHYSLEHIKPLNNSPRKSDASVIIHSRFKSAEDIVAHILSEIQDCYSTDVTIESLTDHLDEIFESVKQFDQIAEQLNEANKVSTELTHFIDEKESEIEELKMTLESAENQGVRLQKNLENAKEEEIILQEKIAALEAELETGKSDSEISRKLAGESKEKLISLETERDAHSSKLESLQKNYDELQEKLQFMENELDARTSECEELQETIQALEIDLEAEQALRSELDEIRTKYNKVVEDLDILNNENLDLEAKNSELTTELEAQVVEQQELQAVVNQLRQGNDATEVNMLKLRIATLENSEKQYVKNNTELQERLNSLNFSKESLLEEIEKKNNAIGAISRRKGQLDRDMDLLTQNFNKESKKAVSLERQMLSLVRASSGSNVLSASNAGSVFKQQTYHRMLELDKEVNSLREKAEGLQDDLKKRNQMLVKRSTNFGIIMSEALLTLQKFSGEEWQHEINQALDEVRRTPGNSMEDYKKLAALIRDCIKSISNSTSPRSSVPTTPSKTPSK